MYLVISKACDSCGAQMAIILLPLEPTKEQIKENEESIGGMFCINTKIEIIELNKRVFSKD